MDEEVAARPCKRAIEPDFEEQGEIDRDPVYVFRLCARDHVRSDPTQSGTRNEIAIVYPYPYQRRDAVYIVVRATLSPFLYRPNETRVAPSHENVCVHRNFSSASFYMQRRH